MDQENQPLTLACPASTPPIGPVCIVVAANSSWHVPKFALSTHACWHPPNTNICPETVPFCGCFWYLGLQCAWQQPWGIALGQPHQFISSFGVCQQGPEKQRCPIRACCPCSENMSLETNSFFSWATVPEQVGGKDHMLLSPAWAVRRRKKVQNTLFPACKDKWAGQEQQRHEDACATYRFPHLCPNMLSAAETSPGLVQTWFFWERGANTSFVATLYWFHLPCCWFLCNVLKNRSVFHEFLNWRHPSWVTSLHYQEQEGS